MGLLVIFVVIAVIVLEYRIRLMHKAQSRQLYSLQTKINMLLTANNIDFSDLELPESFRKEIREYIRKNNDYKAQKLIKETLCINDNTASIILLKIKDPLFAVAPSEDKHATHDKKD